MERIRSSKKKGEGIALLHPSQAREPLRSLRSSLSDPLPLSRAVKDY
ncbi:MAG: hypothetical protein L3J49_02655 [Desulfobulbaceae bacterium]|nr:hypothetical protein [Desulfobulbaceae bacterium]